MRALTFLPILLLAAAAAVIAYGVAKGSAAPSTATEPDTAGRDTPQLACAHANGWNVCPPLRDVYLRHADLLGKPISGFDVQTSAQRFLFGTLIYRPANPPDWQVEFANVGSEDYQLQGYTPRPGSEPHPAVRDWLTSAREGGIDTVRVVGRLISEPLPDKKTGLLKQWAEKAVFVFPAEATTADQVQRVPVGESVLQRQARSSVPSAQPRGPDLLPAAIGLGLALAAGALMVAHRGQPSRSQGTV